MKKDNNKSKFLLTSIIALSILALVSVFFFRYSFAFFKDTKTASANFTFQSVGVDCSGSVSLYKDSTMTDKTASKLLKNKMYYFKGLTVSNTSTDATAMFIRIQVEAPSDITVTLSGLSALQSDGYYYYIDGSNLKALAKGGELSISGTIKNTSASEEEVSIKFIVSAVQKTSDTTLADASTLTWPSTSTTGA